MTYFCYGTNQFIAFQGYTIQSRQARHFLSFWTESGLHCQPYLLSDRCYAGNPWWEAAACYKWADTLRDSARLKISPSHLMLAPRTGKCVWRPLALFFISLWRTQPLHKQSKHDTPSDCDRQLLTLWMFWIYLHTLNLQTHRTCRSTPLFIICADKWAHINRAFCGLNYGKDFKAGSELKLCPHTSLRQDVQCKQTSWFIYLCLWHLKTTEHEQVLSQCRMKFTFVKHKEKIIPLKLTMWG